MNNFLHSDTLRIFLVRLGADFLRSLEATYEKVRAELSQRLGQLSVIVDTDTTALMTFRSQEGATRNPQNTVTKCSE